MTYFYDPCDPCCDEEGSSCDVCDSRYEYQFDFPVLSNNNPTPCTCFAFDRMWTLLNIGACVWQETFITGSCIYIARMTLGATKEIRIQLQTPLTSSAIYRTTSVDCEGSTVWNRISNTGNCLFWPATITVSKV